MTTVYTRQTTAAGALNQNAPLTNEQLDANFINLNNEKQAALVSGTNIKTVNGNSLLGSGDLPVTAGISDAPSDGKTYGRKDAAWAEAVAGPAASVDNEVALFDGISGKLIKGGGVLNTGAYAEEDRWKLQAFYVMAMTPAAVPTWVLGSYYPWSNQVVANGHTAARGITGDIYTMTDGVWALTDPFDANSNGSRIVFPETGDTGPFLWTRSAGITDRTVMWQGSGNIRYSEGSAGVDLVNYTVRAKLNEIGRLINLTTVDKASIVAAINELVSSKADISSLGTAASHDVPSTGDAATGEVVKGDDTRLSDSRTPTGAAGGVLSGSFPNPGFAVDMATQSELDGAIATRAPLTGAGTSGTWPIAISGNAATATNVAWSGVTGKPAVIAAGADAATARSAIGAGTSNLALGVTGSTALAGNTAFQVPLVSGTSIKTVNSTSLLGAGDVAVQPTLVSGTNIKTVGGVSLLGSGNIAAGGAAVGDILQTVRTLAAPEWLPCDGSQRLSSSYSALAPLLPPGKTYNWTARTLPYSANWYSVTYGNGIFVAVANSSALAATSPNGVTWTARTLPSYATWFAVAYGNGIFVAVAAGSALAATSPDGVTWTARTLPSSATWYSVTYGNGIFVAVANGSNAAATSPDGVTWTARTLPSSANWYSVTYGNGIFVAVANGSNAAASFALTDDATQFTLPHLTDFPTKYIKATA